MHLVDDGHSPRHQQPGADRDNEIGCKEILAKENGREHGCDCLCDIATEDLPPEPFETVTGRRDQLLTLLLGGRRLVHRSPLGSELVEFHSTASSRQWISSKWRRTRCNRVRYAPSE